MNDSIDFQEIYELNCKMNLKWNFNWNHIEIQRMVSKNSLLFAPGDLGKSPLQYDFCSAIELNSETFRGHNTNSVDARGRYSM